jgi:NAD(P)-dependent dehydrogenase (short-subunit alcohol dehydrogenase family)
MARDFAGKIALVTGANGALGSALSMALAKRGATVVMAGRNVKAMEKLYDNIVQESQVEPAIYPINFEGAAQLDYETMAEKLQDTFGGVDVLAWCAGQWHGMEALNNLEPPRWLTQMHLNCTAPWLVFRALFDSLRARAGLALFPLAPRALIESAFTGVYGSAQAGLRNWVHSAASENERLHPAVFGVELPPLKSKLRLASFPAESIEKVRDAAHLCDAILDLSDQAPGVYIVP